MSPKFGLTGVSMEPSYNFRSKDVEWDLVDKSWNLRVILIDSLKISVVIGPGLRHNNLVLKTPTTSP